MTYISCVTFSFADNPFDRSYDISNGLSHRKVGGVVQDRNGLIWISTWNGLNCYDGYDFHWVRISSTDSAANATNHIRDIMLSPEGNIFCHTDEDIFEYDLGNLSFRDISSHRKDSLAKIMGRRWGGLTDRQWNQWTLSKDGLHKKSSHHYPATVIHGTERQHPRAMITDREGRLWISTSTEKGINIYNIDGSLARRLTTPYAPYAIFQASDGTVWIGCKPGTLMKADGEKVSDDIIYDISEDAAGNIWLATFGSGVKVIGKKQNAKPVSLPSSDGIRVRRVLITPSQNIIAATNSGLLIGKINSDRPESTRLRMIKRQPGNLDGLGSNTLMDVAIDKRGNIYIATESSGIDMISEESLMGATPSFSHLTASTGALPSDNILAMAVRGDSLLMAVGADNVAALNLNTLKAVNFNSSFWVDSCRFAECAPLALPDGSWIFGSEQGALRVSSSSLWSTGYIPPIVFTTLSLPKGEADFCLAGKDRLSLDADSRNITIKYAALDYTDNRNILYRTRLDGSEWTSQGSSRAVTLFNLAPGQHLLEVQSTDCYGRWVDNITGLSITVAPLWHETWWAKTLFILACVATAAASAWGVVYVRRVNRQRREFLSKYMELLADKTEVSSQDCHPEANDVVDNLSEYDKTFLNRVRGYVDDNISNPNANVDDMAAAVAVSRSTLNRRLKSKMGISPAQLLIEARLQRAASLLKSSSDISLNELADKCGYSDVQYFHRSFRKRFGVHPYDYKP